MSKDTAGESGTRIGLDEVIAAAGQGALRALGARQQGGGFYIDLYIRCGIPPVILQSFSSEGGAPALAEGAHSRAK